MDFGALVVLGGVGLFGGDRFAGQEAHEPGEDERDDEVGEGDGEG